ncbi:hypothetical protein MHUMG1_02684 [Metarhizium humberi]|uniref:Uncharacterized protein n=1 Tax=Metarhizium humberi TaxID=2596975 RepID=A0A9P8S9N5_9HYPO|nr:hypothetical protein MHUMG1_02684 [Metarhizium humberi]
MSTQHPPTYQQVTGTPSSEQHAASGQETLVLDGRTIISAQEPFHVLYELNTSPCDAITRACDLHKVRYQLSRADGEGQVRNRLDHIYSFKEKSTFSLRDLRKHVLIEGKTSQKRTYKETLLSSGTTGWTSCTADGHFTARIPITDRLKSSSQIVWKSPDGTTAALEARPKRRADGSLTGLAQLNVEAPLKAKDLDLLVACWMARLWRESKARLDEQLPSHKSNARLKMAAEANPLDRLTISLNQTRTSPPTVRVTVTNENDGPVTIILYNSPLDSIALVLGIMSITPDGAAEPLELRTMRASRVWPPGPYSLEGLGPGASATNDLVLREPTVPMDKLGKKATVFLQGRWMGVFARAEDKISRDDLENIASQPDAFQGEFKSKSIQIING